MSREAPAKTRRAVPGGTAPPPAASRVSAFLRRVLGVFGSFGLAVTLLVLLLILTFVGTFAQGSMSLFDVQRRYFDALIAVVDVGPVSIPLPGALLTLSLLAANLVVGGIIRLRRSKTTMGVLVAHLGVLLLLAGGLVEAAASDKGQMTLREASGGPASRSDRFESYYEWELVVAERLPDGKRVEHVIPGARAESLDGGVLRATADSLPFDVLVSGWMRNARPRRAASASDGVRGWVIEALDPEREAERNIPMAEVTLAGRGGTQGPRSLVWGLQPFPWAARVGDRTFEVDLHHRSWTLPFTLRLDRFVHETHPGTRMDSRFSSYVTKIEGGVERQVHVTMNEPLRHRGYTFYQSGWGPSDAPPGTPLFSTFSVVRNPADRVPILACFVIAIGLLLHFGRKVLLHTRTEATRRAAPIGSHAGSRRAAAAPVLASVLALVAASATAASAAMPLKPQGSGWTARALERSASIPVQDGGRIKPLDSHAAFTLLRFNHRRAATDAQGGRLTPLEWMLDVLFRPEAARAYPTFLVEDSQVLDAIGLAHDAKGRRDRYSFAELAPARARLAEKARAYMQTESKERTQVENGVVELYGNLEAFDALSHFLDFARVEIPVPEALRDVWPGRERVTVVEALARLDALTALGGADDPHAGVAGAPDSGRAPDAKAEAASAVVTALAHALEASTTLAIVPPAPGGGPTWSTPGIVLLREARKESTSDAGPELVRRWIALTRASGDPAAFEREVVATAERSAELAGTSGEAAKVKLEVFLNRLDPFYRALYFYVGAFLLIALSWAWPQRRLTQAAWVLILAGAALHLSGIVIRSVLRGHPPVSTLYDTTVVIAWIAVVGLLVAERIHRRGVALSLTPVVGGLLLFVGQRFEALKGEDTLPQLVAVLDTNFWLALHVTCITIGYAGGLLASAVAHVHVLGRVAGFKKDDSSFYGLLSRMTYGMLGFALLFSLVGTILGGIWANESWGRFWGWDPKENGALMICLSLLAILHARMGGLLKAFGVAVATIGMGCVVAFSWWGVNLLGIGLHSYGFTGGILRGLLIFFGVEATVIAAAAATHLTGRTYGTVKARGAA